MKKGYRINKIKILNDLLVLIALIGIIGIIYYQGRIDQQNKDREIIDDYIKLYDDLAKDYEEYRANSYILHH